MRAVVQRVHSAAVEVEGRRVGSCGEGFLVLVAAHRDDEDRDAEKLADRVLGLRVFGDPGGKMNLSLSDLQEAGRAPGLLVISNFTLYGDTARSRRPSFVESAAFERGRALYERFVAKLRQSAVPVAEGEFGAQMDVSLVNNGPVTLIVEVGPSGGEAV